MMTTGGAGNPAGLPAGLSMQDGEMQDGEAVFGYQRGTVILTALGERPVESLRRGDLVVSHFSGFRPVKWVGRQFLLSAAQESLPVKIAAGALGQNIPNVALHLAPGHGVLLGGGLVEARDLVNGVTVTRPDHEGPVAYYAVELESHDCVQANRCWSESFLDGPNLRARFDNAPEFHALFPGYAVPESPPLYAPRRKGGAGLEAALLPVIARAAAPPGPLRGRIDVMEPGRIEGWAWDEGNPETPVLLGVFAGGEQIGEMLACHYRPDLAAAGLGRGRCMFSFTLPGAVSLPLAVRRIADGEALAAHDSRRPAA